MRKLKLFLDAKAANTPPRGISKASRVIFSVLTLLFLSIGQVWATEETKTEGFETKTASTSYNSTVTVTTAESDCGIGWTIYYGTVSTNDKISGSNSAQMRYYSSSDNRGYVQSTTPVEGLSNVAFKARVSSLDMKLTVSYSEDELAWTALATNIAFVATGASGVKTLNYDIPSGGKYIKFEVAEGSTKPSSSNIKLIIDDVVFTYETGSSTSTCATPTFSPAAGTFYGSQEITLATGTDGASIYYTTDGTTPSSTNGTLYEDPFEITATTTIKAIAVKEGANDSEVASATYTKGEAVSGYTVDFESDLAAYVDWEFTNLVKDNAITAHGGTYFVNTNAQGSASATTKEKVAKPGVITYYISKKGNNTNANSKWSVQVSTDGSNWTTVGAENNAGAGVTEGTWNECSADLSEYTDVYVRVYYKGTTAVRTLDDIELTMASSVAKPTISGDANFVTSTTVTISHNDADAIYYTTNGDVPTTSSTLYSEPFELTNTATVKAIAVKGSDNSPVAEKTFTKVEALESLAALLEATTSTETAFNVVVTDWVVTGVQGTRAWIADAANEKGILLYKSGHGFEAGNKLNGVVIGTKTKLYQGYPELTTLVSSDVTVTAAEAVTPRTTTIAALTSGYNAEQGTVVKLEDLTYSSATSMLSDGENSIAADNKLFSSLALIDGTTYDITGVVEYLDGSVVKIMPRSADDVVAQSAVVIPTAANLAALKAATKGTYILTLANAVVTYVNGKNAFIEDATAGALIYIQDHEFNAGDCLNGDYQVTTTDYQGKFEITAIEPQTGAATTTADIPLTTVSIATLNENFAAYESRRVKIEGADVTDAISGNDRNGAINDGAALAVYASVANTITLAENTVVNIIGYPGFHNTDEQLTVWAQEDIEDVTPAPKYTVRLWNTASGWDAVNAHVWNATGNITEWPGEATTFAAGWNTFEVEEGNSLLFCKADGSAQTVDITEVTADACYVLTGEADGSGHLEVALDTECVDRFYVAGNTELTGEYWNAAGARLQNGYVTFTNVPAGAHEFKVTNGSWNWDRGAAAFDSENSNVENTGTNNVGFATEGAKDITITYDEANNKIAVQAEDYVAPAEPEYRAVVVAYGDKYYAMTTTLNNKGFTPLEVTIDGEGNVVVNSAAERTSILWKYTEGNGTAMFQDAEDKYLAHTGTGTDLMLQAADTENPEVWTWDSENGCYYVAVTKDNKTTNRSFFYQENANKFKNYGIETNLGKNGYSGAPVFYAADKVLVSTTAKLRFFAPVAWENVIARKWEGGEVDHVMTAVEEGSRWFECDMEKGVPFLVYNGSWDGLNQTEDIAAIDADKCFAWSGVSANGKYNVAEITSCEMSYYIAGDEALTGVAEWGHKALSNNALSFNEVAADTYKFKITNGSWAWNLGAAFVDADACVGVTIEPTDDDGNVVFTIENESNITIAYNPATEKISIVADVPTPKEYYTKVTSTEDITAGTYLIVYEGANLVFDGGLTTLDAVSNTIPVTISEGKIEVTDQTEAAAFFIDPEIGTIKSASGKYIGVLSNSNGLKQSEKIYTYKNAFSIDGDGNAVIAADFEGSNMVLRYNSGTNQNRFRYYGGNQQPIQLYKKAEAAKASPELAFAQSAVEAIKGDAFVAPTLSNEHNVIVAYEASNNKASVDAESGEVTINNAGDVTIYAVSAANDYYRESYAKYTISIKAYETVRGSLELNRYYTICLNKNITDVKGATFWNLTYKDADQATKVFIEEAETLEAGKPYVFQATADKLEVMYGTEIEDEPVENGALRGTFDGLDEDEFAALQGNIYILKDNAIRPRTEGNFLGANRAYIEFDALEVAPAQGFAPGRRVRAIPMQQNGATGFEYIEASEKPMKLMIDGKIYILRGEKMYDATGRLVK